MIPLLGLLLLTAETPSAPPDEGRAALTALIAMEPRLLGDGARRACIRPELRQLGDRGRPSFGPPGQGWLVQWHIRVTRSLASRVSRLSETALDRAPADGGRIDPALVPAPLRLGCGNQSVQLAYSAPVVVEGLAFINRHYFCDALCSRGELVVLQKRRGRWVRIVSAVTWIS